MGKVYTFTFKQEPEVLLAALKVRPPAIKVRGVGYLMPLKLLHCVLIMLGGVCIGYLLSDIFTSQARLLYWGTALGIALSYLSIFENILVGAPVLIRQMLATRANRGEVTVTVDATGLRFRGPFSQSDIQWAGIDGTVRSKLGFVFWFSGSRPSIPFSTFENDAQIDAFEADVAQWLEAA